VQRAERHGFQDQQVERPLEQLCRITHVISPRPSRRVGSFS
jgi:hypothetical protein